MFMQYVLVIFFFFSSRRRHTRLVSDWSSDVCSSDLRLERRVDQAWIEREHELRLEEGRGLDGETQIGRASCRERGEKSGVAVALKKKKEKKGVRRRERQNSERGSVRMSRRDAAVKDE